MSAASEKSCRFSSRIIISTAAAGISTAALWNGIIRYPTPTEISKELLNWTDTYVIEVFHPDDALCALMFVLAIDAEKCSRNN